MTPKTIGRPTLILVHESEAACRRRLAAAGFVEPYISEITSYLAQSTDMEPEFGMLERACAERGVAFRPIALDDAPASFQDCDPATTLVWTLTDGIAYFRGGAAPALARLYGLPTIGADDSVFALCQDKFRAGSVMRALGLPAPAAGLARDGEWIVHPPASASGYFVKPNRLGAKIGIWEDSRCASPDEALELSRRIHVRYRDDAIVQPYVDGRNVRASFLSVEPRAGMGRLGICFVDSGSDFQTMADSMALYGETGTRAREEGSRSEPRLHAVCGVQPRADSAIRDIAARLVGGFGLADVFSMDLRVEADDSVYLIEFEVCPGLPCFDFRAYCRENWGLELAEAMAATAANRLIRGPSLSAGEAHRSMP
jgi:D-alanine-D-alanine ligase